MRRVFSSCLIAVLLVLPLVERGYGREEIKEKEDVAQKNLLVQTKESQKVEADKLFQKGSQQFQKSQFQEAQQSWERSLNIYQQIRDRAGESASLGSLGNIYRSLGNYSKAIYFYQQSLAITREIGDRAGEGAVLGNLGSVYDFLGQYAKAIEIHQQSLVITREIGDRAEEGAVLGNLGNVYRSLREYPKAIEFHQQSLIITREIGNRAGEGTVLTNLGNVYRDVGQYQKAISFYQQSLVITRKIGDRAVESNSLNSLGDAYRYLGKYPEAIEFHQQSLIITREIGDRAGESASLGYLGNIYLALGKYPKAIEVYQQSLAISQEIGTPVLESTVLSNLGNIYFILGKYSQATNSYQQSLAIDRKIGNRAGEGTVLNNLGNVDLAIGQYLKAIDLYQKSLTITREIGDRAGESRSLGNLGSVYFSLKQYPKAFYFYKQSLIIKQGIGNRSEETKALGNLGNIYLVLEQYPEAIDFYQKSLGIAREINDLAEEGASLNGLGSVYFTLKEYSQAIDFYRQSLAITRRIGSQAEESTSLSNLGNVYFSLGQYSQAIKFHQESLKIDREIGNRTSEGNSLNNLGLTLLRAGKPAKAELFLRQGIEIWESLRKKLKDDQKISIFEGQANTYRILQEALIAQNKPLEALEISERGRTRALVELLAEDLNLTIQPPSLADIQAIAKAQNVTLVEYSIIYDDVQLEGIQQAKESALYIWVIQPTGKIDFRQVDLKPLWQEETTEVPASTFSLSQFWQDSIYPWRYPLLAVLGLIAVGSTLGIAYLLLRRTANKPKLSLWLLSLLAITSTSSLAFTLYQNQQIVASRSTDSDPWQVPKTALEKLVDSTREEIADSRGGFSLPWVKDSSSESLQTLHQLLIDPIADLLPSDPASRVIFIPQRELFFVPFPALQDASEAYLIEKHTILTAPSIQTLQLTREQQKGVGSGENLIVGNPTMPEIIRIPGDPPDRLDPLEASETEAKRIAELLGGQPLLGNSATEMAVTAQMPNARIIHLATHGLLDDFYQSRIPGAIALASDPSNPNRPPNIPPEQDGLLTATEIYEMNLNAELVVLSACKTGLGRVTSDGMVGLSRSFFHAGVPSVLVSLWNVPDAPTADLMEEFYQNWQQNPDKAQALRQAMLATKAKHPEPRNWAAFALMGEAETLR